MASTQYLDKTAKALTRDQMVAIVRNGKGVLYKGEVITDEDQLPTLLELHGSDPATLKLVEDDIFEQEQALAKKKRDLEQKRAALQPEKTSEVEPIVLKQPNQPVVTKQIGSPVETPKAK